MKKAILLAMPEDYQLGKLIEHNLVYLGFDVIRIISTDRSNILNFKYRSKFDRFVNFLYKLTQNKKKHRAILQKKYLFDDQCKIIDSYKKKIEYGLFIRADFFEDNLIEYAKRKVNLLVSYHYDGLFRSEKIFDKIKYFNSFYVFNKIDLELKEYSLKPATNFYFDFKEQNEDLKIKYKFYFLGSHQISRFKMVVDLKKYLYKISNTTLFEIVFCQADFEHIEKYSQHGFVGSKTIINYDAYLKKIKHTEIIIDLLISEHSGLSFRVFESIKYKKKLITNNAKIKQYNFYNNNNILVLDESNFNEIENFIKLPYQDINDDIYKQYSFTNWLNYILEIEPNKSLQIY